MVKKAKEFYLNDITEMDVMKKLNSKGYLISEKGLLKKEKTFILPKYDPIIKVAIEDESYTGPDEEYPFFSDILHQRVRVEIEYFSENEDDVEKLIEELNKLPKINI